MASCSSEDNLAAPVDHSDDLAQLLTEAGMVVPLGDEHDTVVDTSTEEEDGFRYTYEVHDALENMESVVYLGMNDDIVWPGNMVRGDHAHQFVYEPITAPRGPLTMSISMESAAVGGDLSEVVQNPSLSTVRQGINNLVTRVFDENTHVPAQVDFSYQQVYSCSQMNMFVGVDVSYGAGDLESSFNWDQHEETTKIVAKYQQVYYSIDLDTPAAPVDLFNQVGDILLHRVIRRQIARQVLCDQRDRIQRRPRTRVATGSRARTGIHARPVARPPI